MAYQESSEIKRVKKVRVENVIFLVSKYQNKSDLLDLFELVQNICIIFLAEEE